MHSLRLRLMISSVLVAVVGLVIVGVMAHQFTSQEFHHYLTNVAATRGGGMGPMGPMPQMMRDMMGLPERAFLGGVDRALWMGGIAAVAVAILLSWQLARQITSPLHSLTAAAGRIAGGDLKHRVDIRGDAELESLAAAFNHMADSLEKNEAARRQLVADVAHDLRTPLAILQANIEAIQDGVAEPNSERLETLHQETRLLTRLVTDLRDLSLAEVGRLPLEVEEVDLAAIVHRAVDALRPLAEPRAVQMREELPAGGVLVRADERRIEQVLRNLLDNALRYTPGGGAVTVAAWLWHGEGRDVQEARVLVRDTGAGIAPNDLPHVFDRFYRGDASRSRATGGSGIGLALVKQLVEAQGGRVWVKSELGHGSEFGFSLPAAVARESSSRGARSGDGAETSA